MPTDTPSVWLTEVTYDRARVELALLLVQRNTGSHRGDREQRPARIRQLQELLSTAAVGHQPPDDGVAEPGMVLTVQYAPDDLTETFLMADRENPPTTSCRSTHPSRHWAERCAAPPRGNSGPIRSPPVTR